MDNRTALSFIKNAAKIWSRGGEKNVTSEQEHTGADEEFIGLSSLVKTMHFSARL
jgi:hypothetical protein